MSRPTPYTQMRSVWLKPRLFLWTRGQTHYSMPGQAMRFALTDHSGRRVSVLYVVASVISRHTTYTSLSDREAVQRLPAAGRPWTWQGCPPS